MSVMWVLMAMALPALAASPPAPLPRPVPVPAPAGSLNVLMVVIDDMRPELEPYGAAHMHTPNMAKLAQRSMLFSRAYVQVAVCMPSRNALLFGRRPDTAKAWNISPLQFPRKCGGARCAGNECGPQCGIIEGANATDPTTAIPGTSLPGWFYKNGFYTVGMGKVFHEGPNTEKQDFAQSWTPSTTNNYTGLYEAKCVNDCHPTYKGVKAKPSWFAFDSDDIGMQEGQLANHAVKTLRNLGAVHEAARTRGETAQPFFLAVGFHKPHIPWYAPAKYWQYYPNETTTLAPHPLKPEGVPQIALQTVAANWARPRQKNGKLDPLDCTYTDMCGDIWHNAPNADGRPTLSPLFPYDNSSFPEWKAKEIRRAYWAAISFTDRNIGVVLDELDASGFANDTVVCLWGDHGYALGDNGLFAKHANFEHATKIPFMISVPGMKTGVSHALVEQVDLFPTLIAAATRHASNPVAMPHCSANTQASRGTAFCTEGTSLMPILAGGNGTTWGRGAWSQFPRKNYFPETCCDCHPQPDPTPNKCCTCNVTMPVNIHNETFKHPIMGYSLRVDKWRYTLWVAFNQATTTADFNLVFGRELYFHPEAPLPIDFAVEHVNLALSTDAATQAVRQRLHDAIVKYAARPDLIPPSVLAGLVV